MNGNDIIRMEEDCHIHSSTVICKHCGKPYYQDYEDQVPGFRDMDYDYCPYCKEVNGQSMTYEYHNRAMSDDQIKEYINIHTKENDYGKSKA